MRNVNDFPLLADILLPVAQEWSSAHPDAAAYMARLLDKEIKFGMFCSQVVSMADQSFYGGGGSPQDIDLLVKSEDYIDAGLCLGTAYNERYTARKKSSDYAMFYDVWVTKGLAGNDEVEFMRPLNDIKMVDYDHEGKPQNTTYYKWYPTDLVMNNCVYFKTAYGAVAMAPIFDSMLMYALRKSHEKQDFRKIICLCVLEALWPNTLEYREQRSKEVGVTQDIEEILNAARFEGYIALAERVGDLEEKWAEIRREEYRDMEGDWDI